jgi:hypothetical protein
MQLSERATLLTPQRQFTTATRSLLRGPFTHFQWLFMVVRKHRTTLTAVNASWAFLIAWVQGRAGDGLGGWATSPGLSGTPGGIEAADAVAYIVACALSIRLWWCGGKKESEELAWKIQQLVYLCASYFVSLARPHHNIFTKVRAT